MQCCSEWMCAVYMQIHLRNKLILLTRVLTKWFLVIPKNCLLSF